MKILLDNLQLASDFEASITKKWATPVSESASLRPVEWRVNLSQFADILVATAPPSGPMKSITSAFEPHMGVFVEAQNKCAFDYHES